MSYYYEAAPTVRGGDKVALAAGAISNHLVDRRILANTKINSCSFGRGQQQFLHPRPKVFNVLNLLEDGDVFFLFDNLPLLLGPRFLCKHWEYLRLFAVPKRRLVYAIHLARRSRLASG